MSWQSVMDDVSPDEKPPQFLQDISGFEEWATEIVRSVETRRGTPPVPLWAQHRQAVVGGWAHRRKIVESVSTSTVSERDAVVNLD
jgi:hypothetical protein